MLSRALSGLSTDWLSLSHSSALSLDNDRIDQIRYRIDQIETASASLRKNKSFFHKRLKMDDGCIRVLQTKQMLQVVGREIHVCVYVLDVCVCMYVSVCMNHYGAYACMCMYACICLYVSLRCVCIYFSVLSLSHALSRQDIFVCVCECVFMLYIGISLINRLLVCLQLKVLLWCICA